MSNPNTLHSPQEFPGNPDETQIVSRDFIDSLAAGTRFDTPYWTAQHGAHIGEMVVRGQYPYSKGGGPVIQYGGYVSGVKESAKEETVRIPDIHSENADSQAPQDSPATYETPPAGATKDDVGYEDTEHDYAFDPLGHRADKQDRRHNQEASRQEEERGRAANRPAPSGVRLHNPDSNLPSWRKPRHYE